MRAIATKAATTWSGEAADRVVLDYDDRHRRRVAMTGKNGTAFLLDLPAAEGLRGGDALVLEDGRLVEVIAAPEPLLEIRCTDAKHLVRVAWHFGNRHVPAQLLSNGLRIRRDHVLAELAAQLGAAVAELEAPFDPEAGAYAAAANHHHHRGGHIMAGEKRMLRADAARFAATNAELLSHDALYRLMTWLSPAYPVGAFAYSSGIEWAVEAGDIADAATLHRWLEAMLSAGSGMSDGIFFAQTHRAVSNGDDGGFVEVAELAAAFVATRERHLETTTLGRTFLEVTRAAWPCPAFDKMQRLWSGPVAYPVAVAVACSGHGIPPAAALHAFLIAVTSSWISAGVRLIPLGHTESQRLMRALEPAVAATAQRALATSLDDIGSATFRADLASAKHEAQYTRLFRS